jgi:hypothetical protein
VSFAPGPDPEKPQLNGTQPPPAVAAAFPRYSVDRSSTVIHAELALWIMSRETGVETDADGHTAAAECVFQQLFLRLSQLISRTGSQALLSRVLRLTQVEFPFLEGVRAGSAPEACLVGLRERAHGVDPVEAARAMLAVLGTLLDVLVGFIGEDLIFRVVQEVWLDLPLREPTRPGNPDGQEASL